MVNVLTLVTGGVCSGKSALAESLCSFDEAVTYVATGPQRDDVDWIERIAVHQQRRPSSWRTVETDDVAAVLSQTQGPMLVDCLGTWLTGRLDALEAWDVPRSDWRVHLLEKYDVVVQSLKNRIATTVLVTNEVGWSVVPAHRSSRIFVDELGRLNQQVAQVCDCVLLAVAGCSVVVKQ